ncbi:MAG: succinate dehydrogenase assembly factor 2 [Gammaproteobacteria bacterium]
MGEDSRLRWLCRRGMKELDIVMTRYLETRYPQASEREKQSFRDLLALPDPDLYSLLLGRRAGASNQVESLAQTIRKMGSRASLN